MNKAELSQKIANQTDLTKAKIEQVLDSFVNVAMATMKAGGEVTLTGFGTFSARARKGREGINPRNPSEKITIPTVVVAKFKAGKNLKDVLKGKVPAPKAANETVSAPEEAPEETAAADDAEKPEETSAGEPTGSQPMA